MLGHDHRFYAALRIRTCSRVGQVCRAFKMFARSAPSGLIKMKDLDEALKVRGGSEAQIASTVVINGVCTCSKRRLRQ